MMSRQYGRDQALAIKEFVGYIDAGMLRIVTSQEYHGPPFLLLMRQIVARLAKAADAPAEEAELAIYCDDLAQEVKLVIHRDGPTASLQDVEIFSGQYGNEESKSWSFSELQALIAKTGEPATT